jgi:hypothetical protein
MTVMPGAVPGAVPLPENAWAGQGAVLLDIGGDVGALVVEMPAAMVGLEVEIRPLQEVHAHDHRRQPGLPDVHDVHGGHAVPGVPGVHGHGHLAHVAVVARPVDDGRLPSLVFADLEAGRYELFQKDCPDAVALRVEVIGGAVTSGSWPA